MKKTQHSVPVSSKSNAVLEPVYLKLPPKNIVSLKFTLESYEGLGIVRTLDSLTGEVVILAISDTIEEVHTVVEALAPSLEIRKIPPPESMKNDWLLAEETSFLE